MLSRDLLAGNLLAGMCLVGWEDGRPGKLGIVSSAGTLSERGDLTDDSCTDAAAAAGPISAGGTDMGLIYRSS